MTVAEQPPVDRFCDLVMKGGITSGVVYPKAIALLARSYRFKNIGGTSAGAIAASVTAAAEYQRRRQDSNAGFELLDALPALLSAPVDAQRSKLLSLFQPDPRARRLFGVLIGALNSGGTVGRIVAIVRGLLVAYWFASAASLLVALLVYRGAGLTAAILALLLALLAFIGYAVYLDVTRQLVDNDFGMCTGMTVPGASHEALTPWLHQLIQQAAGLTKPGDEPLTFGALWHAGGLPKAWTDADPAMRSIDLQMFSTNLAHGRPYVFPLPVAAKSERFRARDRLFFKERELRRFLPDDVLRFLLKHGKPYRLEPGREEHEPADSGADARELIELPEPEHFPVLLAARMSLSFPILFCAVPLWAIDYDPPPGQRAFRRCWFSDGGISSNFPMHLFDGLLPSWPTFGINLEEKIPERDEMVYLPKAYEKGYGERWNRFDQGPSSASRFGGFVLAIVGTMQNWNDNTLGRMPGIRDRIARVRLKKGEGGMNLNMEQDKIAAVTGRGMQAAEQLMAQFVAASPQGPMAKGWDDQRWVRLGVLLKMIEERAAGVHRAAGPDLPHATSYQQLIADAAQAGQLPAGYERPLTHDQQRAIADLLSALDRLVAGTQRTDFYAIPKPELRVRPPL
jgi:predicted acylesterase/phospholipase RssA